MIGADSKFETLPVESPLVGYPIAPVVKGPAGVEVIRSNRHRLLLDLDTPEAVVQFVNRLHVIERLVGVQHVYVWVSRGGNTHAVVETLAGLAPLERVALEALLGSDPWHVALTIANLRRHPDDLSNVLFKPERAE